MNTFTRDLAAGPVYRTLIYFAMPLVLASFLQSLYSIVDMLVSGRYCGGAGLSGVTNGGMVMTLVSFVAMGLSTGANVTIGQCYGAREETAQKMATSTSMGLMLALGCVLSTGLFLAARPLMIAMHAPALEESIRYFRICSVGIVFVFGYNGLSAIIRAVGDSRTPLLIIAAAASVNVGLDFLCIAGLKMGVAGAAVATVASQIVSFTIALFYTQKHQVFFGFSLFRLHIYGDKLHEILKVGVPCALLFCINGLTHLVVTVLINGYGVTASAGSGIGVRIMDLATAFITAMMNAAATVVAQCIGAARFERVKQVQRATLVLMLCVAGGLMVLVGGWAPQLTSLFVEETDVIEAAVYYLRVELALPLFFALFNAFQAIATGAGDTHFVMWNAILGLAVPRLLLSNLLHALIGLTGVYLGCVLAPIFAIPMGIWYYKTDRWMHRIGVE